MTASRSSASNVHRRNVVRDGSAGNAEAPWIESPRRLRRPAPPFAPRFETCITKSAALAIPPWWRGVVLLGLLVRFDDARHQRMTHHIRGREVGERNAAHLV